MSQIITKSDLTGINAAINDALGALVADGINDMIENMTSRSWGEVKTVTERYNASGVIWLNHMDITAVTSVKTGYPQQDQETLESSSYHWTPDGRLELGGYTGYSTRANYVEVTYSYGVAKEKIPYDLKMAAVGIALSYADWLKNSGKTVNRAQSGSYMLEFARGTDDPTKGGTVTRDIKIVESHALRRV